jgi:hypothetical protein
MIVVVDEEKLPSDAEGRLKKRRDQGIYGRNTGETSRI